MKNFKDIPAEVYEAAFILNRKYIGKEQLDRAKETILKYKEYFPIYYNFFTADQEN